LVGTVRNMPGWLKRAGWYLQHYRLFDGGAAQSPSARRSLRCWQDSLPLG
jgi:hypothetical protein